MSLRRWLKLAALAAALAFVVVPGSANGGTTACDRWASVTGSDAASGSESAPYRSVAHLTSQLGAGETGCLEPGTFNEAPGTFIVNSTNGTAVSPVTVTSANPEMPASIVGQLWLKEPADHVIFRDLQFMGSPGSDKSVMLLVGGADGVSFIDNNITFARGICLNIGVLDFRSEGFRLEGNRIHDCGSAITPTGADSGVHGVYLLNTQDAVIYNNWIYDNKNRGIQHYPNADGTLITNNLLDGNGSNLNLSSEYSEGYLSEGIVARDNLITNSDLLALSNPNWPDADSAQVWGYGFGGTARGPNQGDTHGNLVTENCIFQPNPADNFGGWGYAQTGNIFADPMYTDRAGKDFTLLPGSPCAGKGPDAGSTPPPVPPDTFVGDRPKETSDDHTARFTFSADQPDARFECRLDGAPASWGQCSSPTIFKDLGAGRHRFEVRATGDAGPDRSPSVVEWTIRADNKRACAKSQARVAKARQALAKGKRLVSELPAGKARSKARNRVEALKRELGRKVRLKNTSCRGTGK